MSFKITALNGLVRIEPRAADLSKFASLEVGQIVSTFAGPVFRVISKIAGADAPVIRLANLAGKPVNLTAEKFAALGPITPLFARIAARFRFLGSLDFNTVIHEILQQGGMPIDPKMDWDAWFQRTLNKLYNNSDSKVKGPDGRARVHEAVQDMIIRELVDRKALTVFDPSKFTKEEYRNAPLEEQITAFLVSRFTNRYSDAVNTLRDTTNALKPPPGLAYKCKCCGKKFLWEGNAKSPKLKCPKCAPAPVKGNPNPPQCTKCDGRNVEKTGEDISSESIYQKETGEGQEGEVEDLGGKDPASGSVFDTSTPPNQEEALQWEDIKRFSKLFEAYLKEQRGKQAKNLITLWNLIVESAVEDTESSHSKRNLYSDEWEKATGLGSDAFKGYLRTMKNLFLQFIDENPDFEDKFEIVRLVKHSFEKREVEVEEMELAAPKASSLHSLNLAAVAPECHTCGGLGYELKNGICSDCEKINRDDMLKRVEDKKIFGALNISAAVKWCCDYDFPENQAVICDKCQEKHDFKQHAPKDDFKCPNCGGYLAPNIPLENSSPADLESLAFVPHKYLASEKTAAPDMNAGPGANPNDSVVVTQNKGPEQQQAIQDKSMPSTRTSPGTAVAPQQPQQPQRRTVAPEIPQVKHGKEENPITDPLCCENFPECDCAQLEEMPKKSEFVSEPEYEDEIPAAATNWVVRGGEYWGDPIPEDCVAELTQPGAADEAAEWWQKRLGFNVPREAAIEFIVETGGWTAEDLVEDSDDKLSQIVLWIVAGSQEKSPTPPDDVDEQTKTSARLNQTEQRLTAAGFERKYAIIFNQHEKGTDSHNAPGWIAFTDQSISGGVNEAFETMPEHGWAWSHLPAWVKGNSVLQFYSNAGGYNPIIESTFNEETREFPSLPGLVFHPLLQGKLYRTKKETQEFLRSLEGGIPVTSAPKSTVKKEESPLHPGAICSECGRTVTQAEYSYGGSKCCNADVQGEEHYGSADKESAEYVEPGEPGDGHFMALSASPARMLRRYGWQPLSREEAYGYDHDVHPTPGSQLFFKNIESEERGISPAGSPNFPATPNTEKYRYIIQYSLKDNDWCCFDESVDENFAAGQLNDGSLEALAKSEQPNPSSGKVGKLAKETFQEKVLNTSPAGPIPEEDFYRDDNTVQEQRLNSPESPTKPWFCMDCNLPVDLDQQGRCENCQSEAVDVASHGKRPEGMYPAPVGASGKTADESNSDPAFEKFTQLTWYPNPSGEGVELEQGIEPVKKSLEVLKKFPANFIAIYWEGYAGGNGTIRIAPLKKAPTSVKEIASAFGADPGYIAAIAEDGYVSFISKNELVGAFTQVLNDPEGEDKNPEFQDAPGMDNLMDLPDWEELQREYLRRQDDPESHTSSVFDSDCACGGTGVAPSIDPDSPDGYDACPDCEAGKANAATEQLTCEIRDAEGDVESVGTCSTTAECVAWYREHSIPFADVTPVELFNGRSGFSFTKTSSSKTYEERVRELEEEGCTRSDAQAVVDAEDMKTKTSALEGEYGVRWTEAVGRNMSLVTKSKFFPTNKARMKFCERLEQKDSFIEFMAWAEPQHTASSKTAAFQVGDKVRGRMPSGRDFPGTVTEIKPDGTYIVSNGKLDRPFQIGDLKSTEEYEDRNEKNIQEDKLRIQKERETEQADSLLKRKNDRIERSVTVEDPQGSYDTLADYLLNTGNYELWLDITEDQEDEKEQEYLDWCGQPLDMTCVKIRSKDRSVGSWVLSFPQLPDVDYQSIIPVPILPARTVGHASRTPQALSNGTRITLSYTEAVKELVIKGLRMQCGDYKPLTASAKTARDLDETMEWTDGNTYRLTTWQERDNFTITLMDESNDREVMHLVDEAAIQFVEDGFFDWKNPIESCLEHAEEMGLIRGAVTVPKDRNRLPQRTNVKKSAGWDEIRPGDRLTIKVPAGMGRNGQEWAERSGRVVMRSATGGWVLNMGGAHGTPGLADPENTVKIIHKKADAKGFHTFVPKKNQAENTGCAVCGASIFADQHKCPPVKSAKYLPELKKHAAKPEITGVRKSGEMTLVEFGPKGIDGHCSLAPKDMEAVKALQPEHSCEFQDEQGIYWEVYSKSGQYLFKAQRGGHGFGGSIPYDKLFLAMPKEGAGNPNSPGDVEIREHAKKCGICAAAIRGKGDICPVGRQIMEDAMKKHLDTKYHRKGSDSSYKLASIRFQARQMAKVAGPIDWMKSKTWPTQLVLALATLLITSQGLGALKTDVAKELQDRGKEVPAQLQSALPKGEATMEIDPADPSDAPVTDLTEPQKEPLVEAPAGAEPLPKQTPEGVEIPHAQGYNFRPENNPVRHASLKRANLSKRSNRNLLPI